MSTTDQLLEKILKRISSRVKLSNVVGPAANGISVTFSTAVESITGALKVIDYPHHEIHEGNSFVASQQVSLSSATRKYLITTPNTHKRAHFTFRVRSSVEANVVLYENPTDVSGGTALASYNRNRNSSTTAGITVTYAPTEGGSFAAGTAIFEEHFGSGKTGADSVAREEFILKENEQYLFYVTTEASSGDVSVILDWYEHENL